MTSPAGLLRRQLTAAENALVSDAVVESALRRARAGQAPRTRTDVAALRVYRGPGCTRVPPLEALRLPRPPLTRLLARAVRPHPRRGSRGTPAS